MMTHFDDAIFLMITQRMTNMVKYLSKLQSILYDLMKIYTSKKSTLKTMKQQTQPMIKSQVEFITLT